MSNERENEWVLVPREPTSEMMDRGVNARSEGSGMFGIYRAMLAAPSPPADVQVNFWEQAVKQGKAECYNNEVHVMATLEWIERRVAALAAKAAAPAPAHGTHCQNGRADVCLASQRDGVICADDECDIDSGIRAAAPAPVAPSSEDRATRALSAFNAGLVAALQVPNTITFRMAMIDALATAAPALGVPEPCRRHECRRVRIEMQAEIDRLRAAGVGEAVAIGSIDPSLLALIRGGRNGTFSGIKIRVGDDMKPGDALLYTAPPAPQGALDVIRKIADLDDSRWGEMTCGEGHSDAIWECRNYLAAIAAQAGNGGGA